MSASDRKGWIELARQWHALPVAIVCDPGIDICIERNKMRPDRAFGGQVVQRMYRKYDEVSAICSGRGSARFGNSPAPRTSRPYSHASAALTDKRHDRGPFDIIGDVHGCADELTTPFSPTWLSR